MAVSQRSVTGGLIFDTVFKISKLLIKIGQMTSLSTSLLQIMKYVLHWNTMSSPC